jgi:hypothetical protein
MAPTMSIVPPPGLRLMVYDETDIKRTFSYKSLDGETEQLDIDIGLSHSWFAGGYLYRALGQVDYFKGFSSWDSALEWLATVGGDKPIAEIEYWGHGSPGKVWLNGKHLNEQAFSGVYANRLKAVVARLKPSSTVWIRSCSVFAGQPGHKLARAWATGFGCRVAAHTHIIGPWQSGLHSIQPGQEPSWSDREGILAGTAAKPTKMKTSTPWAPNTITCLRSDIPKGW